MDTRPSIQQRVVVTIRAGDVCEQGQAGLGLQICTREMIWISALSQCWGQIWAFPFPTSSLDSHSCSPPFPNLVAEIWLRRNLVSPGVVRVFDEVSAMLCSPWSKLGTGGCSHQSWESFRQCLCGRTFLLKTAHYQSVSRKRHFYGQRHFLAVNCWS